MVRFLLPISIFAIGTMIVSGVTGAQQHVDSPTDPIESCGQHLDHPRHDPIDIIADAMLLMADVGGKTNGVRSGTGSADDPFVIEDWYIRSDGPAISIKDTRLNVTIRNVVLESALDHGLEPLFLLDNANITLEDVVIRSGSSIAFWADHTASLRIRNLTLDSTLIDTTEQFGIFSRGGITSVTGLTSCAPLVQMIHLLAPAGLPATVSGLRSDHPTEAWVLGGRELTVADAEGPIGLVVHGTGYDETTIRVIDSKIWSLDTGDARSFSLSNTTIKQVAEGKLGGGLYAKAEEVVITDSRVEGFEGDVVWLTAGRLHVSNSVFHTEASGNVVYVADRLTPRAQPRGEPPAEATDLGDGPFIFEGNDILTDDHPEFRAAVHFNTLGSEPLRGTNNYVRPQVFKGPVEFTDAAGAPNFVQSESTEAPPVATLTAVMAVCSMALARRRVESGSNSA